jgi:hypothetical protein
LRLLDGLTPFAQGLRGDAEQVACTAQPAGVVGFLAPAPARRPRQHPADVANLLECPAGALAHAFRQGVEVDVVQGDQAFGVAEQLGVAVERLLGAEGGREVTHDATPA